MAEAKFKVSEEDRAIFNRWFRPSPLSDVRAVYSGFGKWIGILTAGVSLFSLVSRAFALPLSELVAAVVAAYRSVFHPIAQFLFGWFTTVFQVHLPDWWPDCVVVYFLIGGAVARTYASFYDSTRKRVIGGTTGKRRDTGTRKHFPTYGPRFFGEMSAPRNRVIALVLAFMLWPIALWFALASPIVARQIAPSEDRNLPEDLAKKAAPEDYKGVLRSQNPLKVEDPRLDIGNYKRGLEPGSLISYPFAAAMRRTVRYVCDLRIVFALQLVAAGAACAAISIVNAKLALL